LIIFRHEHLRVLTDDRHLTVQALHHSDLSIHEETIDDLRGLADLLLPGEGPYHLENLGQEEFQGNPCFTLRFSDRFLVLKDPRIGLNGPVEHDVPVVLVHQHDPKSILVLRNFPDEEGTLEITLHGIWQDEASDFETIMTRLPDRTPIPA
jgi:hypothetical protein